MINQVISLVIAGSHDPADLYGTARSEWMWSEIAPYEVVVRFGDDRTWHFARELVIEGVEAPSGLGDVHLWPSGGEHNRLRLESPDGWVVFEMERKPLKKFARALARTVPAQREIADADIERYLKEWSRS